jgi:hypothetical protein
MRRLKKFVGPTGLYLGSLKGRDNSAGIYRCRCEDDIKMDVTEVGWEVFD